VSADESLARAESDLAGQRAKEEAEQPVQRRLEKIRRENDVARLLRAALGSGP